jgi:preprotein translocase subunit SecE
MESQHQKWVNLSYLALAALVGYVVFTATSKIVGAYDLEARVKNIELILRVVSVAAGAILFTVLFRNNRSNQFMNEVVVELSRVTWPTQKDTASATMIVVVMVVVSGMVLGFLDYLWVRLLQWVL